MKRKELLQHIDLNDHHQLLLNYFEFDFLVDYFSDETTKWNSVIHKTSDIKRNERLLGVFIKNKEKLVELLMDESDSTLSTYFEQYFNLKLEQLAHFFESFDSSFDFFRANKTTPELNRVLDEINAQINHLIRVLKDETSMPFLMQLFNETNSETDFSLRYDDPNTEEISLFYFDNQLFNIEKQSGFEENIFEIKVCENWTLFSIEINDQCYSILANKSGKTINLTSIIGSNIQDFELTSNDHFIIQDQDDFWWALNNEKVFLKEFTEITFIEGHYLVYFMNNDDQIDEEDNLIYDGFGLMNQNEDWIVKPCFADLKFEKDLEDFDLPNRSGFIGRKMGSDWELIHVFPK